MRNINNPDTSLENLLILDWPWQFVFSESWFDYDDGDGGHGSDH